MHRTHHRELRLLLTCFYIYLSCQTFLYVKQVIFRYSLLSSPFQHPYLYIHIRAIVGSCISLIYRFLLLYAVWRKMGDLLLISILFLATLSCLRLIFDFYGYFSGYIKQSLYYPFTPLETKGMAEEIIDLVFALLKNAFGLALSFHIFKDIIKNHRLGRSTTEINHRPSISECD